MKIISHIPPIFSSFCLTLFVALFTSFNVYAQTPSLAELQSEFRSSPWLVTVDGERRLRVLRVTSLTEKSDESLLLEATYGWIDNPPGTSPSISASVNKSSQGIELIFASQMGSKVIATQIPDRSFEGTIAYKTGEVKKIRIQRIPEAELQTKIAAAQGVRTAMTITMPTADVPAACASFIGKWTGIWGWGVGQLWLWVFSVDSSCNAKIAYVSHARPPTGSVTATIKDGVLSFVCNSATGDTCNFTHHGDTLWASASSSQGSNNAVFEKIQ